jgi:hypothetical protein
MFTRVRKSQLAGRLTFAVALLVFTQMLYSLRGAGGEIGSVGVQPTFDGSWWENAGPDERTE